MTTSMRKRFGLGVIFVSVLAGVVLSLFGVPLLSYESHAMDGVSLAHIEAHWPLIVLLAIATIGAIMAARSRLGKTNG
jgi:hypothetical protein